MNITAESRAEPRDVDDAENPVADQIPSGNFEVVSKHDSLFLVSLKKQRLVMEALIQQVSEYELGRNKPMPTLIHGAIQANLSFELKLNYRTRFRVASEVLLDTQPTGGTPDVVLYPFAALDYKHDPSRRTDAPLLTIEIQSASQSTDDMVDKLEPYFYFGVQSCWIVIPKLQAILVYDGPFHYHFFHGDEILKDVKLNIELDLKKVFE